MPAISPFHKHISIQFEAIATNRRGSKMLTEDNVASQSVNDNRNEEGVGTYNDRSQPGDVDEDSDDTSGSEYSEDRKIEKLSETVDTSKYPNPKKLTGYDLKRALKMTKNAEVLFRCGTFTQEDFDKEISRAWKLNEGTSSRRKKKAVRKKKDLWDEDSDDEATVPIRRSTRAIDRPRSAGPLRRSTRKTKRPAEAFVSYHAEGSSDATDGDYPQKSRRKAPKHEKGTESKGHDPMWSSEEHSLFIEGLQLYAKEADQNTRWTKIAVHVETKSVDQVREHAAKPFNTGSWSKGEIFRFDTAWKLYGNIDRPLKWKAKAIASIVQTRNPTQCSVRLGKQQRSGNNDSE